MILRAAQLSYFNIVTYLISLQPIQDGLKKERMLDTLFIDVMNIYIDNKIQNTVVAYHGCMFALLCRLQTGLAWIYKQYSSNYFDVISGRNFLHIMLNDEKIYTFYLNNSPVSYNHWLWFYLSDGDYLETIQYTINKNKTGFFDFLVNKFTWKSKHILKTLISENTSNDYNEKIKAKLPQDDCCNIL